MFGFPDAIDGYKTIKLGDFPGTKFMGIISI